MAITVDGLISGLNTTGIITKLIELEKRPVKLLENKQQDVQDKLLAFQEIKSKLLALETAAQKMNKSSEFQAMQGSFRNTDSTQGNDIVTVSANSNVSSGTYSFTVTQLAQQHKVISNGYTSTDTFLGTSGFSVTTSTGTSSFTSTTLSGMRDDINNANIGLNATIINTTSGSTPNYRLLVTSSAVGADASFSINLSSYQAGPGLSPPNVSFTTTQQGQDAVAVIDGVTVSRSSNSFDGVISGTTINAFKAGSGTLTLGPDTATVVSNVEGFVNAYNDFVTDMKSKDFYNTTTKKKGVLFGNGTSRTITERLRNIITGSVAGLDVGSAKYSALSHLGITSNSANLLVLDKTVLQNAIENDIQAASKVFSASASGSYSFVYADGSTRGGNYTTKVVLNSSGQKVLELTLNGTSTPIQLTRDGNFLNGPAGSILDGLILRVNESSLTVGTSGTMDIGVGIAEQIAFQTGFMTEFSNQGLLFNERFNLEKESADYTTQISDLNARIAKKKLLLQNKFTALETTLAGLKGQGNYITNQLASLKGK